jgi:hypothetical protein
MKNITRKQAAIKLQAIGANPKVVFGTSLSAKMNRCSVSLFCTDTRGRNIRADEIRIHPLRGIGGTASDAVKTAKKLASLLNIPAGWETGSLQTKIQYIRPDGTVDHKSCVSPLAPAILPLP